MRTFALALKLALASWQRVALLASLVALSLLLLLVVAELSRLSSNDLDDAIAADVGHEGTFTVEVFDTEDLDLTQLTTTLVGLARELGDPAPRIVTTYPPIAFDCPPLEGMGSGSVVFAKDTGGHAWPLPYGSGFNQVSGAKAALCFAGWKIPLAGVYLPSSDEQALGSSGIFVRPEYEPLVRAATTGRILLNMSVVAGRAATAGSVRTAALDELRDLHLEAGLDVDSNVGVVRTDQSDELGPASEGIRFVYQFIGWGVVLLAAAGILTVQLVIVRGRMWLFGLARALGGRRSHIVILVLSESVVSVVLGGAFAVAASVFASPGVSALSQRYFGTPAQLWGNGSGQTFALAVVAMLVLAAVPPVRRALTAAPLDTLEGRG